MFGIDISSYQHGLSIKDTGASFAIMKATDGTRFVDRCCDGFVRQCKRDGILWGFYHFANGAHKSSMRAQAQYFVSACRGYFGEGVPFLDWEDSDERFGGAVVRYGPSAAKEWLDEVYRLTGVRPMIYMSKSVARSYDWSLVARDYGLWCAQYASNAHVGFKADPWTDSKGYGAFGGCAIYQYTGTGRLPGWGGDLDLDIAYMDADAWHRYARPSDGTPGRTPDGTCPDAGRTPDGTCPDAGRTTPNPKPADTAEKVEEIMASTAALITPTHNGKPLGFVAWYDGHELRGLDNADQPTAIQKVYEQMGQDVPSFYMEDNWFYRFCTAVSCSDKALIQKTREFFPNEGR